MRPAFLLFAFVMVLAACVVERPGTSTTTSTPQPESAWTSSSLASLLAAADAAPAHGLPPLTADLDVLKRAIVAAQRDPQGSAEQDAKADALFRTLALAFSQGVVDPAVADPAWAIPRATAADVDSLLPTARQGDATQLLSALLPQDGEYAALERALARVAGEPAGAVDADGVTREVRLDHLRSSLERRRWLPRPLPPSRLEVRVPLFDVRYFGAASANHRVIVGARATPTPSFLSEVTSVTVNPAWTPPMRIVKDELWPRFRRDPARAVAEGFEIFDANGQRIAWADVDWTRRKAYSLRQSPGPRNALGRIRFDMPNRYAIYMHDTPSQGLFARADRALSHGCIRTEKPIDLARAMLAETPSAAGSLDARIATNTTQTLDLPAPVPVYVLYLTAAGAGGDAIAYGSDIYGRDAKLIARLDRRAVRAQTVAPAGCA